MTYKIDRLLGSRTRVSLLSKLLADTGGSFYIRELSRELRIPYSMVYKEEKNLAGLGVIKELKRGRLTVIEVNRELPYLEELKGLILKTGAFSEVLRGALSGFKGIKFAVVYGSFASGGESAESDVDLLIIGKADRGMLVKKTREAEGLLKREINYIVWNEAELKKRLAAGHNLIIDIRKRPVIMIAGEEREFRRAIS